MDKLRLILLGIFCVVAVAVITAMIHLVATYVAVLAVLAFVGWVLSKTRPPREPP